jgi:prepilin-type N-terminal cleavage/methylation domain-containing protein
MKPQKNASESGFTLIEVIITIVLVAIVAAMMTAYFGKGITQSSLPIFGVKDAGKLNEIMEKISAEYSQHPQWQKSKDYAAETIIVPTPTQITGLLYKASKGLSGTTEPTWPIPGTTVTVAGVGNHVCLVPPDPLCTVTDNGVTWQLYGTAPTLALLRNQITAKATTTYYGYEYSVIDNVFIKFDPEVVKPDGTREKPEKVLHDEDATDTTDVDYGKYLKVTIALASNPTGEKLTTLFVLR